MECDMLIDYIIVVIIRLDRPVRPIELGIGPRSSPKKLFEPVRNWTGKKSKKQVKPTGSLVGSIQ